MYRCTICIFPVQVCQYRGYEAFQAIMLSFRNGSGKHDCIVLLSGGRDSSYLLAYVVNELKLRPFALIVVNRFLPHETMQNIDNRILLCYFADVAEPARFGNDCVPMQWLPRFHKKGRHENSSRQRSGHSNRG